VEGEIKNISLSEYLGKYVVLFFYPKVRVLASGWSLMDAFFKYVSTYRLMNNAER
jgi:hypothetical protein